MGRGGGTAHPQHPSHIGLMGFPPRTIHPYGTQEPAAPHRAPRTPYGVGGAVPPPDPRTPHGLSSRPSPRPAPPRQCRAELRGPRGGPGGALRAKSSAMSVARGGLSALPVLPGRGGCAMGGTDPAVLGVPCHPVPSRPVGEVVLEAARGVRHRGAGGSVRGTLLCTNVRVAFVPGAQVGTSPHRDPPPPIPPRPIAVPSPLRPHPTLPAPSAAGCALTVPQRHPRPHPPVSSSHPGPIRAPSRTHLHRCPHPTVSHSRPIPAAS